MAVGGQEASGPLGRVDMITRGPDPPGLILIPPGRRRASRVWAANSSLAPARGYFEPPPPRLPSPLALGLRHGARQGPPPTLGHAAGHWLSWRDLESRARVTARPQRPLVSVERTWCSGCGKNEAVPSP